VQIDWETNVGTTEQYPGLGAGIAAFEDGTLTNERWKCSTEHDEDWHTSEFDDSPWPFAVVQDRDCCPWRDPTHKWKQLDAKWIAPANFDSSQSFPGVSYCRYTIKAGERLMDGSDVDASTTAPAINVTDLVFADSTAKVTVSVSERSTVFCMLCDSRFVLRTPSPLEIEAIGTSYDVNGWVDVTVGNFFHLYNIEALQWYQAGSETQCQALCDNYATTPCSAITFFVSGVDTTTGKNCKLMTQLDNALLNLDNSTAPRTVKHFARQSWPATDELSIPGLLYPSTLYSALQVYD
jgi:hypothetical protein